ncbi:hypothetical protein B0H13DRAFT_2312560 [Mycena leptocephala]|nr:hypothetical protein B0H13DRAFT_2312560 [Mycena leptocephala]
MRLPRVSISQTQELRHRGREVACLQVQHRRRHALSPTIPTLLLFVPCQAHEAVHPRTASIQEEEEEEEEEDILLLWSQSGTSRYCPYVHSVLYVAWSDRNFYATEDGNRFDIVEAEDGGGKPMRTGTFGA